MPIVRPIGPERPRGNLSGRNPSAPIGPRYAQGQPYGPRRGAPDNPAAYRGGRFYRAGPGPQNRPLRYARKKRARYRRLRNRALAGQVYGL